MRVRATISPSSSAMISTLEKARGPSRYLSRPRREVPPLKKTDKLADAPPRSFSCVPFARIFALVVLVLFAALLGRFLSKASSLRGAGDSISSADAEGAAGGVPSASPPTATAGALTAAPSSPSDAAPPPPLLPNVCDHSKLYNGIITDPLQFFSAAVNGGSQPFHILLPSAVASTGFSQWESVAEINAAMERTETMMTAAYERILVHGGFSPAASIVIEVGTHEGWFSSLAHHYGGFRVFGFDMQPLCALLTRCTSAINGAHQHAIFNSYVGHGEELLNVGNGVCGGGLGIGDRPDGITKSAVPPTHLAKFFSSPARVAAYEIPEPLSVALLKSDTEGYEPFVLETALGILPRISNFLIEVFPSRWALNLIPEERGFAVFECLFAAGFEAVDLPRKDIDFTAPGEIDLANLPAGRLHATWTDFKSILDQAKAGKSGLVNPNVWLRWSAAGLSARASLDLATLPACALSLAHAND